MGLFKKESLRQSLITVLAGSLVSRGLGFLRNIVFARLAGPSTIGLFSLGTAFPSLLCPVALAGRGAVLVRHAQFETASLGAFARKYYAAPVLISLLLFVAGLAFSTQSSMMIFGVGGNARLAMISSALLPAMTLYYLALYTLHGLGACRASTLFETAYGLGLFILGFLMISFDHGAAGLLTANLLAFLGAAGIAFYFLNRGLPSREDHRAEEPSPAHQRQDWTRFGRWAFWSELAYGLINTGLIGRWVVGFLVSTEGAGFYFLALNFAALALGSVPLVCKVLLPAISEMSVSGRVSEASEALRRWKKPVLWGYMALSALLLIGVDVLVPSIYGAPYQALTHLMPSVLCAYAYHAALYLDATFALGLGRSKELCVSMILGAATELLLNPLLTWRWGLGGAGFSLVVTFLVASLSIRCFNSKSGLPWNGHDVVLAVVPLGLFAQGLLPALFAAAAGLSVFYGYRWTVPRRRR